MIMSRGDAVVMTVKLLVWFLALMLLHNKLLTCLCPVSVSLQSLHVEDSACMLETRYWTVVKDISCCITSLFLCDSLKNSDLVNTKKTSDFI